MAKEKKERPPKKVQEPLPEMGVQPKNPKIHAAVLRYVKERDARMEAGRDEVAAKNALIELMVEQKVDHYVYGDVRADLDTLRKLKCKVGKSDDDGEGDDE
jgi:predicted methyltransferase MtxX (methanogen marker protein 4)